MQNFEHSRRGPDCFLAIINSDNRCIWSREFCAWTSCLYARMDSFRRRKTRMPKRGANEQDPYAVMIVKRTSGHRTKVFGHTPRIISTACNLFLRWTWNIECAITGARCYSSDLPQVVACTMLFSGDAKLMLKIKKLLKEKTGQNRQIRYQLWQSGKRQGSATYQARNVRACMVFKEVHKPKSLM